MYRTYNINENFFDVIDNEEKAYVLWFIYADGNNKTQGTGLMFTISKKDISILEKIKSVLCSNAKITIMKSSGYSTNTDIAHIDFNSIKIYQDLIKLGAPPNKTYKIVFPTFIDQELIRHFIRGYFDGDGCIWNGKRKVMNVKDSNRKGGRRNRIVHNVKFTITSNVNFLNGLQQHLIDNICLSKTKFHYRKKNNPLIATMEYSGRRNIKKFYDYIYKDSTIYLDRKFNKFKEILSITNNDFTQ